MNWKDHITLDPAIVVGKPVINGTRLTVGFILELLAEGWTNQQILDNYPGVTIENIQACLAYAAESLQGEKIYSIDV